VRTVVLKMPDDGRGADQWAGQAGEHRLTRLVIPLPRETAKMINSCVALFILDDEHRRISPLITAGHSGDCYFKDGKVYLVLWRALTQARSLRVQLECYSDDAGRTFIDRTAISERIMFGRSLSTCLRDFPEASDQPSILAQLIAWMHPPEECSASDTAFRFTFAASDWLPGGPGEYRITVPLETHGKGPFAYVSAANAENGDGEQENAVFGIRRTPRGDIIVTSAIPVAGEIFIEKGAN